MKTLGEHALDRLLHLRDADGWWRAYRMTPGVCRDWVTALAGLALSEASHCPHLPPARRSAARQLAGEVADMLLGAVRSAGGWGYNMVCACDADTTAAVIRLLLATDRGVPATALRFLAAHGDPQGGYATFIGMETGHDWQRTGTETEPAAAVALYLAGRLKQDDLCTIWQRIADSQCADGSFPAYWYSGRGVATHVTLDLWHHAGRPDPQPRPLAVSDNSPVDLAHYAMAARLTDGDDRYLRALLDRQIAPGRWAAMADLLAPQGRPGTEYSAEKSWEGPGVMTAIAALRAVLQSKAAARICPAESATIRPRELRLPAALGAVATASGMSGQAAETVRQVAEALNMDLPAVPWPNRAASAFAQGYPVEFSAKLAKSHVPALRFAGETGDPGLIGRARVQSAFDALSRAAEVLDVTPQMEAITTALSPLYDAADAARPAERFFVWAGLEIVEMGQKLRAGLKLYVNLDLGPDRMALATALLDGFGGAASDGARGLDAAIGAGARAQEIGFAAVTGGAPVGKMYWELDGFDPAATRRAMDFVGLDQAPDMAPGIPGIVPDAVCASWSSGLAVRIDPQTGLLPDLTLATETPGDVAFTPQHEASCIDNWAAGEHWTTAAYDRLRSCLAAKGSIARSLHTLTQKPTHREAALYLRPEGWFQQLVAQTTPGHVPDFHAEETHHG